MIGEALLVQYGAKKTLFAKGRSLFFEGDECLYFHQLISGVVKMVSTTQDGKEFIQGVFYSGDSFGEPPLFDGRPYPAGAVAVEEAEIWRLPKAGFFELLQQHFDLHVQFDRILCERLRFKNMILAEISFHEPEHRIASVITYLKKKLAKKPGPFTVPVTRQQLADMSGLRVETVIRTVKKMEADGKLKLIGHKICLP
ncbi:MAG: Crp/Fnr family transcriptional regulator [Cyclobacteriaceae bacterium]|nr:Crp/Fnr family transcriptional regulator [Cyclobacteriaceae bacterium]